jgi:phosphoglycolate phosphatase
LKKICKARYRTFVATSKPAVFARHIIEYHDLMQFFDAVYGSELDGRLTDKAELIAVAFRAESLPEDHRTVMIGDRGSDIKGAIANGVSAIGVTYGYGTALELVEAGAYCLCARPRDIWEGLSSVAPK